MAAVEAGFDWVGICPAVDATGFSQLVQWLEAGYAGEMSYIGGRLEAYRHPRGVMSGVRSLIMLGMNYAPGEMQFPATTVGVGRIARYAWGDGDYHDLIWSRLNRLAERGKAILPHASFRGVVDTAPLLEREFAQLAGLGWRGKNTMLINPRSGSWYFLAAMLTDAELEHDSPFVADHCGTCTACLDACPTEAFVGPGVLDATRCISYLTIESRSPVPVELRPGIGDWLFGCDVCQEVCPWNRFSAPNRESDFHPARNETPGVTKLDELFFLGEEQFRQRFRKTPLWRPRRRGILRNAAIVLGNQRDSGSIRALEKGLNDTESLVRGASAWALGEINLAICREFLSVRLAVEKDPAVIEEIHLALDGTNRQTG